MFEEKTNRPDFEQFRSNTCHKLKDLGDLPFITQLLESNQIRTYYERKWYPEALYLLAMLDYLPYWFQIGSVQHDRCRFARYRTARWIFQYGPERASSAFEVTEYSRIDYLSITAGCPPACGFYFLNTFYNIAPELSYS